LFNKKLTAIGQTNKLSSDKSLIQQDNPALNNTERQDISAEGKDPTKIPHNQNRTYSIILKLICGALVVGGATIKKSLVK
jgi:hypothetical protein